MPRIHQSSDPIDFHVLPIASWISFLERTDTPESSLQKFMFRKACIAAYAKSWIRIHFEMEEWVGSDWPFSPGNEQAKAEYASDWMHTLRRMGDASGVNTGISSCVYTRCLETTDIRWLPLLLSYIYTEDQGRLKEYFPFAFEKAFAKYCRHYCVEERKPENYKSLANALFILKEYYGMTILRDNEESFRSHVYCRDMYPDPSLEMYSRYGMSLCDFDIESWIELFNKMYGTSRKTMGKDAPNSPLRHEEADSEEKKSAWRRLKDWFKKGWKVYRDQLPIRMEQSNWSYKSWSARTSVSFFGLLLRSNGFWISASWGAVLCYVINGIRLVAEFNYWMWLGATIVVFIFRELRIFHSCCRYVSMINKDSWEEDEAFYLDDCRREYCLNGYGGELIDSSEFSHAAHCSVVLSRLICWIGPVLEAYGDKNLLRQASGILHAVQRHLFRDALPHKGKDWPRPPKKPVKV